MQSLNLEQNEKFYERLDDVFVRRGFSTYRRIRRFLQTHIVELNGQRVLTGGTKISLFSDKISADGKDLNFKNDLYILMNKPAGYLCSTVTAKHENYPVVYQLLPENLLQPEGLGKLHTIGRLDLDTEGLLIFTTNGDLSHKLATPDFHVNKKYFIKLKTSVTDDEKISYSEKCNSGIEIPPDGREKEFFSKPAKLEWINSESCILTISEGKFHQVKRMIRALGNEVIYLKRIQMGSFKLDEKLEKGQWRFLSEKEVYQLTL